MLPSHLLLLYPQLRLVLLLRSQPQGLHRLQLSPHQLSHSLTLLLPLRPPPHLHLLQLSRPPHLLLQFSVLHPPLQLQLYLVQLLHLLQLFLLHPQLLYLAQLSHPQPPSHLLQLYLAQLSTHPQRL